MNMQQLIAQAQKAQRELKKALAELDAKEFKSTKGGAVTVKMLGTYEVVSVEIDKDAMEDKDMVQDLIKMAVNDLIGEIRLRKEQVQEEITGQRGGLGI